MKDSEGPSETLLNLFACIIVALFCTLVFSMVPFLIAALIFFGFLLIAMCTITWAFKRSVQMLSTEMYRHSKWSKGVLFRRSK